MVATLLVGLVLRIYYTCGDESSLNITCDETQILCCIVQVTLFDPYLIRISVVGIELFCHRM